MVEGFSYFLLGECAKIEHHLDDQQLGMICIVYVLAAPKHSRTPG